MLIFSNTLRYPTAALIGGGLGRLYGGPAASIAARNIASYVIPTSTAHFVGAAWNLHRAVMIEHAGGLAYAAGTALGTTLGPIAAIAVTEACVFLASKAITKGSEIYNNYNTKKDWDKFNADLKADPSYEVVEENISTTATQSNENLDNIQVVEEDGYMKRDLIRRNRLII